MCLATALSAGLLISWQSHQIFWRDEWLFLLHRRDWNIDTFFTPFAEQFLALPILAYKSLQELFGMESSLPYQLLAIATFEVSVIAVFAYLARRTTPWLALAGCLPILFLGIAWDDLLFPFQISFFASVAFGFGALLALDREDRLGDVAATLLLIGSLLGSAVGIPFVAAATVRLGITRERFRRAFVVAVPTLLWLLWFLGWGHQAETRVSAHNVGTLPGYIGDGFASSIAALLGLNDGELLAGPSLIWGRALLIGAIAFAVWRVARLGRTPAGLWPALTLGGGFWLLCGLNATFFGQANSGRYQYLGAIFLLAIAVELIRGVSFSRNALILIAVIAVAATASNLRLLDAAAGGFEGISDREQAGLAALELSRDQVADDFLLTRENSTVDYLGFLEAGRYFSAIDEYGSPAYTEAELAASPEAARVAADKVFAAAQGIELAPTTPTALSGCSRIEASGPRSTTELPTAGGVVVAGPEGIGVSLARYATESSVVLGTVNAGDAAAIELPDDRSDVAWRLYATGGDGRLCSIPADAP